MTQRWVEPPRLDLSSHATRYDVTVAGSGKAGVGPPRFGETQV